MTSQQQLFFLGATGYIGSQLLVSAKRDAELYAKLKEFTLVALVRDPDDDKAKQLQELLIEEQARKSAITFNASKSDHEVSIQAIVTGLHKRSADHPNGPKPLYIHISGMAILSDNSRGEKVPAENLVKHSDTTFKLEDLPSSNPQQIFDSIVHAAGAQKESPIKAITVYPGIVYGFGEGLSPDTLLFKVIGSLYIQAGVAGTWGPGHNAVSVVHIKDVGAALVKIFKLALEGKAKSDYFISADKAEPFVWKRFAEVAGKILHAHDLLKDPEPKPLPEAVTNNFGDFGWSTFGGNCLATSDRLKAEGWEAVETANLPLWDSLPLEMDRFAATFRATRA